MRSREGILVTFGCYLVSAVALALGMWIAASPLGHASAQKSIFGMHQTATENR